jgi:DNA-binding phage protein
MPLTKSFNETVKADLQKSLEFRRALLREAVGCMVNGDLDTGKSILRQYINGTIGFIKLAADLGRSPKVLMRMFSPSGNPQARSLFEIIAHLQKIDGTVLEVIDHTAA